MAEIVASDTPYARATALWTRTQGFRGIAPTLRHRGRNCIIDRATRLFAAMASENVPKCRRLSTGSLDSAQILGLPRDGVQQAGPLSRLAYQPWQGGAALRLSP